MIMIFVDNKKRKLEHIQKEYPQAFIIDVTSSSTLHSGRILSPFYPHGNIPIPFTPGLIATCVEAVWQGLKVFEHYGVDFSTFRNNTQKDLKRTIRKYGKLLGHAKGAYNTELLGYFDARMHIYLPTYKWVLENVPSVQHVVSRIKEQSQLSDIVLLDYNTNIEFCDISKPLSHAGLIKLYIEGHYPTTNETYYPLTEEESKIRRKYILAERRKRQQVAKNVELSLFPLQNTSK